MKKQILFGDEARNKILTGAEKLALAVTTTLGPKGRNVAYETQFGFPRVIHDGVSVAKEVELEDRFENLGANLIKKAAESTNSSVGDGTTTATLLAYEIAKKGHKYIQSGANPMIMKRGMDKAVSLVISEINKLTQEVKEKDWAKIATISAQDEEIGEKIAQAFQLVGENGVVEIEESAVPEISIVHKEGMSYERGYVSPYFGDMDSLVAEVKSPAIIITDEKITMAGQVIPILEQLVKQGIKDVVFIADSVEGEALKLMIINKLNKQLNILAVKPPAFGERRKAMLEDIAIVTGGVVISSTKGMKLEKATLDQVGRADAVKATRTSTTIIGGKGKQENIDKRIKQLETELKREKSEFDREKLKERIAKLGGGIAVIQVGASSEIETKNLKERVIDAKEATKAAIQSGIVVGGGVTLIQAAKVLDKITAKDQDEAIGIKLISDVVTSPLHKLAENSGHSGDWVVRKILESNDPHLGLDVLSGKITDLLKAGVIEPAQVIISALKNASSVASMILTTECVMVNIEENENAKT